MTLLEVCVDDAEGFAAALAGGADRIELCSALELGGLTPSPGLVAMAAKSPVPVHAMIRHRPGHFVYSAAEAEVLLADIAAMRAAGLAGVVLGASFSDGRLDEPLLTRMVEAAAGMAITLHRAFDIVPDHRAAADIAMKLGFGTILTSGGAASALAGRDVLARLARHVGDAITIMPGAGISPDVIPDLSRALPLRAVHGSCSEADASAPENAARLGFSSPARRRTSREKVAALKAALAAAEMGAASGT
ncbi:MAG: copper homeostasis protein CutC [Devosia sp.]|uniref:copper homeostasis protein CutC n=1 Tax=Devosia sp. TaxID=1871048 RepID=UPI0024C73071|nr:copper homeostasis protein CutC [Devosia sp.]UYN99413.1 MAG: copper homeostasis protein CutC [Devosia sp.]